MAWNEPGGGKDQDPWGRRKEEGPPDLDELVRKMQERFGGLFGGRKGGNGGTRSSGPGPFGFGLLVAVAVAVWVLSGIYIIAPAQQGVVLRFGQYQSTVGPGPHWHLPYPVEAVTKVNVEQVSRTEPLRTQMLTKDQNLIRVELSTQYQVKNAEDYLFKVKNPDHTLAEATESALRDVVGGKTLDDILSQGGGRELLVNETRTQIQHILDLYSTGLRVTKVNLENVDAPKEVKKAFEDAINAEEDEDRFKKQAEALANDILPRAEGDAQTLQEQALAFKQQVVDKAKGETNRFLQTLAEYKKAPEITRKRLYLDTMQTVLSRVSKVLVKVRQGNNIMYIPLDRFMNGAAKAPVSKSDDSAPVDVRSGARTGSFPSPKQNSDVRNEEVR